VKVIVREVYQDSKFLGKPSFPIVRRREVEFRPYTRERLVSPDVEVFSVDEEDDEPVSRAAGLDMDDDEGMHEVTDEDEPDVDFSEDVSADGDSDDDDDE
jgi:hypothetical protein